MQTDFQFQVSIPEAHPCYADHFPNDALVPGALLLKWIIREIENHTHYQINNIKSIKFLVSVRPKQLMQVFVQQSDTRPQIFNLECKIGDQNVIKGQLEYQNVLEKH